MISNTKFKVSVAKILYKVVRLFVKNNILQITRGGISYEVDLSEGIDLSLFLFGNFQSHVSQNKFIKLPEDSIIFDIGANFGIMSLQFANTYKASRVYAFEPTHYALSRLKKNLELNPELQKRITVVNSFVSEKTENSAAITAFSSWKIDGEKGENMHPVHLGEAKSTEGVPSITLDDFCTQNTIERLDFIKIDTDGHEFEVFKGAKNAIAKLRPKIIFEIGLYVMKEKEIDFSFYQNYFSALNYSLMDSKTGIKITIENYKKHIPERGTIDILAIPD